MAIQAISPFLLEDMVLQLGSTDYAAGCSKVSLEPNPSVVKFRGLKPTSIHRRLNTDWAAVIDFAQDWVTAASFSNYLFTHMGETITGCTIKPQSGVGPSFTVDLFIVPGSIGGTAEAIATASVTFGSSKPVLVPAA